MIDYENSEFFYDEKWMRDFPRLSQEWLQLVLSDHDINMQ